MRSLSPSFAASLQSEATTLCHCWRLRRHDGAIIGFTDHDRDVMLDGTLCLAATGLDASQAHVALGLAVHGGDVQGAFNSQSLTEADLSAGLYDDASVEIWTVDWRNPSDRLLMDIAVIGEVRRSEHSFVAELRSLAHRFDEERGRRFQRACSADLGDARCNVDLADPAFSTTGTVLSTQGASAALVHLAGEFPQGFFAGGRFTVTSGAHAGVSIAVRTHTQTTGAEMLAANGTLIGMLAPGDHVAVTAGCDKAPETCCDRFNNIANFRGFPHMPGNDVLLSYPNTRGLAMDGGSLFS